MNRKLYKLIMEKEKYNIETKNIIDHLEFLANKNPFKFLYENDYIFCSNYCFSAIISKKNKIHMWCKEPNIICKIKKSTCNCACKEYSVYYREYKCIPPLYSILNTKSMLQLGVIL